MTDLTLVFVLHAWFIGMFLFGSLMSHFISLGFEVKTARFTLPRLVFLHCWLTISVTIFTIFGLMGADISLMQYLGIIFVSVLHAQVGAHYQTKKMLANATGAPEI